MEQAFLLRAYGACWGPEAGPWNLSVQNKYLEFMFARFFEEHFPLPEYVRICNIGIGAGYWDRYLSYQLRGGSLTSIDADEVCCRQLREGLENEGNPNSVEILCSDVMGLDLAERFDIVTMVGSTRLESGLYENILEKAFSFVKPGGGFYYQSLDKGEPKERFAALCGKNGMTVDQYLFDGTYGFRAQYWKAGRPGV